MGTLAARLTLRPGGPMKHAFWSVLGLCTVAACAHMVHPRVMPGKIPPASPPIRARTLLIITPSFEEYLSEGKPDFEGVSTRFGQAAAQALSALVTRSFAAAEVRRLTDEEAQALLVGAADTSLADLLLVPSFESAGARGRSTPGEDIYVAEDLVEGGVPVELQGFEMRADVILRLDARSLRTGSSFAWVTVGDTGWIMNSWGKLTGSALEQALRALTDSLAAHRAELELVGDAP